MEKGAKAGRLFHAGIHRSLSIVCAVLRGDWSCGFDHLQLLRGCVRHGQVWGRHLHDGGASAGADPQERHPRGHGTFPSTLGGHHRHLRRHRLSPARCKSRTENDPLRRIYLTRGRLKRRPQRPRRRLRRRRCGRCRRPRLRTTTSSICRYTLLIQE